MDANAVTFFLAQNSDKFPAERLPMIKQTLDNLDEQKAFLVHAQEYRSPIVVFLLSFFFGTLGVDRFLIGQVGLGFAKLLTCGGLGFWYLVDLFIIMSAAKESNFEKFYHASL